MSDIVTELRNVIYDHMYYFNGERPFALRVTREEYREIKDKLCWWCPDDLLLFYGVPLQVGNKLDIGVYVER